MTTPPDGKVHLAGDYTLDETPFVGKALKTYRDGFESGSKDDNGGAEGIGHDVMATAGDVTAFAGEATAVAHDPLNYLISQGLAFLEEWLTPLKDALELVTGDYEATTNAAKHFDSVAANLNRVASGVEKGAAKGGAEWGGEAAAGAGRQVGITTSSLEESAECAGHLARLLQISGMLMKMAYDVVNGIIADVVEWLVVTWLAALASSWCTFGASLEAAAGATEGEVASGLARVLSKVNKVREIVTKIVRIVNKILKVIRESRIGKIVKDSRYMDIWKEKRALSFGQNLRGSASGQLTGQFGWPGSGRDGFETANNVMTGVKNVTGDAGNLYTAGEYGTDPGHAHGYDQGRVEDTQQRMIDRYGFPSDDPDAPAR